MQCPTGVINGSLVNPYINYPFQPDTIEMMANYTEQSNAMDMAVKFYYTIRELSNHAAELFPILSLRGEIVNDEDPYTIPQPGYCQEADCHGGDVYLQQHLVRNYTACWQQGLSNGEIDAAVCNIGTSRWFNYYVEGVYWSVAQAPHINGIYYDGINFDRNSIRRVRKVANTAANAVKSKFPPQLDLHTGYVSIRPPSLAYLTHYAYMDRVWNGEGFNFAGSPIYWAVDISNYIHGLTGDRLGGGAQYDIKGMMFGMTQRNSATSPAWWKYWDQKSIQNLHQVGWWDPSPLVNFTLNSTKPSQNCNTSSFIKTSGAYHEACGGESGSVGFGGPCGAGAPVPYPNLTAAEAQQVCCQRQAQGLPCAGFSIQHEADPTVATKGCFKLNTDCGVVRNAAYDGYTTSGSSSTCSTSRYSPAAILASVYTDFQSRAIVVVGSWCSQGVAAQLVVDWTQLGLHEATVTASAPEIPGVQAGRGSVDLSKPIVLPADGSLLLELTS